MTMRDAVTCDRSNCLALLLEPVPDYPAATFEDYAAAHGWTLDSAGHTCPACHQGAGPVLERGECLRCGGAVNTRHGVELCLYCGHPTPDNGPEWHREGWTDEEDQDQDAMPTGPGEWAGAGGEDQGEGAAR